MPPFLRLRRIGWVFLACLWTTALVVGVLILAKAPCGKTSPESHSLFGAQAEKRITGPAIFCPANRLERDRQNLFLLGAGLLLVVGSAGIIAAFRTPHPRHEGAERYEEGERSHEEPPGD